MKGKKMPDVTDNRGKLEVAVRILGNELIAIEMNVDDFKMKWLAVGVIAIVALGYAASVFGPALVNIFGS
jgi:hypothetical protein